MPIYMSAVYLSTCLSVTIYKHEGVCMYVYVINRNTYVYIDILIK